MTLTKNRFFGLLLLLLLPFFVPRMIWVLKSQLITGEASFTGKEQTGQYMHTYAVVTFTVNDSAYWFNGPDNLLYQEGEKIAVRYQPHHPQDARINTFISLWGDLLVYTGIPFFLFLLLYIHPEVFPRRKKIRISGSAPFLALVD